MLHFILSKKINFVKNYFFNKNFKRYKKKSNNKFNQKLKFLSQFEDFLIKISILPFFILVLV